MSIDCFLSLEQIKEGYVKTGYSEVDICTMKNIYYNKINAEEQKRIRKLEWMDEYEEIDLMQDHYFVSIAKRSKGKVEGIEKVGFENLSESF